MFQMLKKELFQAVLIFSFAINVHECKEKHSTTLDYSVQPEDLDSTVLKTETEIPEITTPTSSTLGNTSHEFTTQHIRISDSPNPETETSTPVSLILETTKSNPPSPITNNLDNIILDHRLDSSILAIKSQYTSTPIPNNSIPIPDTSTLVSISVETAKVNSTNLGTTKDLKNTIFNNKPESSTLDIKSQDALTLVPDTSIQIPDTSTLITTALETTKLNSTNLGSTTDLDNTILDNKNLESSTPDIKPQDTSTSFSETLENKDMNSTTSRVDPILDTTILVNKTLETLIQESSKPVSTTLDIEDMNSTTPKVDLDLDTTILVNNSLETSNPDSSTTVCTTLESKDLTSTTQKVDPILDTTILGNKTLESSSPDSSTPVSTTLESKNLNSNTQKVNPILDTTILGNESLTTSSPDSSKPVTTALESEDMNSTTPKVDLDLDTTILVNKSLETSSPDSSTPVSTTLESKDLNFTTQKVDPNLGTTILVNKSLESSSPDSSTPVSKVVESKDLNSTTPKADPNLDTTILVNETLETSRSYNSTPVSTTPDSTTLIHTIPVSTTLVSTTLVSTTLVSTTPVSITPVSPTLVSTTPVSTTLKDLNSAIPIVTVQKPTPTDSQRIDNQDITNQDNPNKDITTTGSSTPGPTDHNSMNQDTITQVTGASESSNREKMPENCSTYFIYKPDLNEDEELIIFIIRGVVITFLAMFGIITNIFAVIIFSWPGMRTPTTCIFRGLAFFDTLTILCSMATRGFPFLGIHLLEYFGSIITPITFPMATISYTGSVYTTMLLAFERFSAIVLCKRIFKKRAYFYMVSIGLFSIIVNIPLFWSFKWKEDELKKEIYCNKTFQYAALIYPHAILRFILPTLFLIFINFFTVREIRKANNALEKAIGRHSIPNPKRFRRDEIQLTKQILVIIGVFIICNISSVATAVQAGNFGSKAHLFVSISDAFITLNCSINVVIYGILSSKFRATLKNLFCACFKKKNEVTSISHLWSPMGNLQARVSQYELKERSQPTNFLRVSTYRR